MEMKVTSHFEAIEMRAIQELILSLIDLIQKKEPVLRSTDLKANEVSVKNGRDLISKVMLYRNTCPELSSKEIDWNEFNENFADSTFIGAVLMTINIISSRLQELQYESYQTNLHIAVMDYQYTLLKKDTDLRLENK